jgi:hypothetical protein
MATQNGSADLVHRANELLQIRLTWHSAERRKGGVRRAGDSRGAECHVGLIPLESKQQAKTR